MNREADGTWAFVLSGATPEGPALIVADLDGIHGRLNASSSSKPLNALLASDMTGIYQFRDTAAAESEYVQFLRDRSAVSLETDGKFVAGEWWTDGDNMLMVSKNGERREWPRASLAPIEGIPAGTHLVVRLLQALASQKVKEGDPVKGVLITPAIIGGKILLPQGSEFNGTITRVHGVGWE